MKRSIAHAIKPGGHDGEDEPAFALWPGPKKKSAVPAVCWLTDLLAGLWRGYSRRTRRRNSRVCGRGERTRNLHSCLPRVATVGQRATPLSLSHDMRSPTYTLGVSPPFTKPEFGVI